MEEALGPGESVYHALRQTRSPAAAMAGAEQEGQLLLWPPPGSRAARRGLQGKTVKIQGAVQHPCDGAPAPQTSWGKLKQEMLVE